MLNRIGNPHLNFGLYQIFQSLDSNEKTLISLDIPKLKYNWFFYQNCLIIAELEYNMVAE